ncbi:hypothetical protein PVK06_034868 [Gossypium arboreum]|uniref:Uncharacterized protein n=1 Tax=Gossypium arboreum TaxID=29729 RepID=A0ABR0NFB7_GOSAR|nr:hypothetical protein PVK06_034868 [Gossypium arboreum]
MNDSSPLPSGCLSDGDGSNDDRNTKKKDKLLGGKSTISSTPSMNPTEAIDGDLEFEDGDILKSTVNGIPVIDFSD